MSPASPPRERRRLSRNRGFVLLWTGESVSELGSSMSLFLLPVLALTLTGSNSLAALVGSCFTGAAVLSRLPAGVVVDRVDRRRLLIVASVTGAALYAALSALAGWSTLPYPVLIVVAVGTGLIASLSGPAESAFLRDLVAVDDLPAAFSLNQTRQAGAQLAGPPVGGLLFAVAPWLPFLLDTVTFATAASTATAIRSPGGTHSARAGASVWRDFADGIRAFTASGILTRVAVSNAVANFAGAALYVLVTLKLVGAGVPVSHVGLVFTIGALAGIGGSLVAQRLITSLPTGSLILTARVVAAAALIPIALTDNVLAVGLAVAAGQILVPAANAVTMTYLSTVMDRTLLGRTQTAYGFTCSALMPFGPLMAGVLLNWLGGASTVIVFCAITFLAFVPLSASADLRGLGRPSQWTPSPTTSGSPSPGGRG